MAEHLAEIEPAVSPSYVHGLLAELKDELNGLHTKMNEIELLGDELPAFLFETETAYRFRGRVLDGRRRVCGALVDPESFETVLCELTPVQKNGEFTILLRVPSTLVGPYWFGVIAGDGGASGLAPVRIQIVSPVAEGERFAEAPER
ncbi:MAG: hypothetical protein IH987_14020 [Planctomycetes bacterium]|nr:hypothetical protein [Planctomycetota bacterium]